METMESIRVFLGWCLAINLGLLVIAAIILMGARKAIVKVHGAITGLSEDELTREYFRFLGNYKTAILIFNFAPYIALRIMA